MRPSRKAPAGCSFEGWFLVSRDIDTKTEGSAFLREKLKKLQDAYLARLPEALATLQKLSSALAADPDAEVVVADLHRAFHSMRGTAATLGLPQISSEGAIGTELMASFKSLTPDQRRQASAATLHELAACTARIEAAGKAAMQPADPEKD